MMIMTMNSAEVLVVGLVASCLLFSLSSSNVSGLSVTDFDQQTVNQINLIRSQYIGTSPLTTSPLLTMLAQNYTNYLSINNGYLTQDSNTDLIQCGIQMYFQLYNQLLTTSSIDSTLYCGETQAVVYAHDATSVVTDSTCNPVLIVQNLWNSQRQNYNYTNPPSTTNTNIATTSAFTQMVWRNTRYIGVGVTYSSSSRTCYVVVKYWPTGNIIGQYPTNVMQPFMNKSDRLAAKSVVYHQLFTVIAFLSSFYLLHWHH